MATIDQLKDYTCRDLVELVTYYLEDALSSHERASLEAHLAGCTGCRNYVGQIRATVRALAQTPNQPIAPDVRDSLLSVFRKWKNEHDHS